MNSIVDESKYVEPSVEEVEQPTTEDDNIEDDQQENVEPSSAPSTVSQPTVPSRVMARLDNMLKAGIDSPVLLGKQESPSVPTTMNRQDRIVDRQRDIIKRCLDRTLQCYCDMQEQDMEDFDEQEHTIIETMACQLLKHVFPKQMNTDLRAMNYLKIYCEIYKLEQMEQRRCEFLDKYSDVLGANSVNNRQVDTLFEESSLTIRRAIQNYKKNLDEQLQGPTRRR